MAEERRAERAGYKADGVDAERLQRSDQRVGRGEIQFRENQRGNEHLSRKSYDSITEPTVEATTARRNCTLCSASDRFLAEIPAVAIAFLPVTCILSGRSHRGHCTAKYCHGGRTGTRGAGRLLNRDNPRRRPPCGPGHGVMHAKPWRTSAG